MLIPRPLVCCESIRPFNNYRSTQHAQATQVRDTSDEGRTGQHKTQNKIGVSNQRNIGCDYHYFNYQTK